MGARWMVPLLTLAVAFPATAAAQTKPPDPQGTINPGNIGKPHPGLPSDPPTVISLGDSAISGEGGRWAGNTNTDEWWRTDALGGTAYHDILGMESIPGCHRSKSAEVHIGSPYASVNFACSGAETKSYFTEDRHFKPGLDFMNDGGKKGQAQMLQEFASEHDNIRAVVVLIGANDYGFAKVAETCVRTWLLSTTAAPAYCKDDPALVRMMSTPNVEDVTIRVKRGFLNVRAAMRNAGYRDEQYQLIAQTYTNPLPGAGKFRYPQTGFTRHYTGGCGIWDSDANWTRDVVLDTFNRTIRTAVASVPNVDILDAANAFQGHRLCEGSVSLIENTGLADWHDPRAANNTEWVQKIRSDHPIHRTLWPWQPYQLQEGGHPNHWGQLALRNCFRQAVERMAGGTCVPDKNLNAQGEPNMTLLW